jgi:ribosomal protein S27AE
MEPEYHYLTAFINEIQVVCPSCGAKATVRSDPDNRSQTRVTCGGCGLSRKWNGDASSYVWGSQHANLSGVLLGQPIDCYFRLPLWYATDFKGEELFAYNRRHLQFLKEFIGDKLRGRRETEHGWSNRSLESRLPKWIQAAKNREGLLKKIEQLENK